MAAIFDLACYEDVLFGDSNIVELAKTEEGLVFISQLQNNFLFCEVEPEFLPDERNSHEILISQNK